MLPKRILSLKYLASSVCVKRGRKLACPPGCHVSNTADLRWSLCISRLLQNGRNVCWLYPIKLKIGYQMWDHCERCNHIFSCQAPLFLMITEKMNLTPSISHSSNKVTRQGEKKKKERSGECNMVECMHHTHWCIRVAVPQPILTASCRLSLWLAVNCNAAG